jgi:hypothetical protein
METLTPRSGYEPAELGITPRMRLAIGAFFGLCMSGFEAVEGIVEGRGAGSILLSAVFVALIAGTVYALLFSWGLVWLAKRTSARVHDGDPRMVLPPPEGYRYRAACMRMMSPVRGVNGVMYLGPQGMRFDPLRRVRARYRGSLVLEPLESITLERVDVPLPRRMRLVGRTHGSRIDIRGGAECVQVMVPATDATFERLQEAVYALRQAGDAGEVDPPASISRP